MNHPKIKTALTLLTTFGAIALSSCQSDIPLSHQQPTHKKTALSETTGSMITLNRKQFQASGIVLQKPRNQSLSKKIAVNGKVVVPPSARTSVSSPYGGFVRRLNVTEGQYVKKGQVLAVLENPKYIDLQEAYLKSKLRLQFAAQEYKRQQTLHEADVTSQKKYQQTLSDFHSLQIAVQALKQKLLLIGINPETLTAKTIAGHLPLNAPTNGYITHVDVNIGKFVEAQEALFEINNTERSHIDLTVFAQNVSQIKQGAVVHFSIDHSNLKNQAAKIISIGKEIGNDRSITIHCLPLKRDISYPSGATVQATIDLDQDTALTIPESAVVRTSGQDFIFITADTQASGNNYLFKMIPINKGTVSDGQVQILQLSEALRKAFVVVKGSYKLLGVLQNHDEE